MALLEVQFALDKLLRLTSEPSPTRPNERWTEFLALVEVAGSLSSAQKGFARSRVGKTDPKAFSDFIKWASKNGIKHDKLELATFGDEGNGLRAKEAIAEGEVALTVPLQAMLSTATAQGSKLGPIAKDDPMLSKMPNVLLTLTLLSELKNAKSAFKEYLAVLPATFSTPLHYSIPELELLKGSPALDLVLALYKNILKQYIYLHKMLKNPEASKAVGISSSNFAFDDYKWAVSAVMTRQNRVPVVADGKPEFALALIPLWDMLNHADGEIITTMHDTGSETTEYTAMTSFNAGDQATMFYGKRTNSDFLLNSGFVPITNADDYLLIKLGVGKADSLFGLKNQLLTGLGIATSGDFVVESTGEPDAQLNAFIRINAMTEAELKACLADPGSCATLGTPDGAINTDNETKACLFLEGRFKLLLLMYGKGGGAAAAGFHATCANLLVGAEKEILAKAMVVIAERGLEEEL